LALKPTKLHRILNTNLLQERLFTGVVPVDIHIATEAHGIISNDVCGFRVIPWLYKRVGILLSAIPIPQDKSQLFEVLLRSH
jgi:hypothetical protein